MSVLGLLKNTSNNLGFNASENTWKNRDGEVMIDQFTVNYHSLKTGYRLFVPGSPPDWHWDEALGKPSNPPTSDHKRGFSVEIETEANGLMVWSGASYGQCAAIEKLMEDIYSLADKYPGKIPVVQYTGSEIKKVGMGQTRIPNFKIIDWVDPAFPPWKLQTEANDTPF